MLDRPGTTEPTPEPEAKLARLLTALERLGSTEAFTIARVMDPERDAELLARIEYARKALSDGR